MAEKVTPTGVLSVIGNGNSGPPAYNGPVSTSPLGRGNAAGVIYFANADNHTIDRIGRKPPAPPAT